MFVTNVINVVNFFTVVEGSLSRFCSMIGDMPMKRLAKQLEPQKVSFVAEALEDDDIVDDSDSDDEEGLR